MLIVADSMWRSMFGRGWIADWSSLPIVAIGVGGVMAVGVHMERTARWAGSRRRRFLPLSLGLVALVAAACALPIVLDWLERVSSADGRTAISGVSALDALDDLGIDVVAPTATEHQLASTVRGVVERHLLYVTGVLLVGGWFTATRQIDRAATSTHGRRLERVICFDEVEVSRRFGLLADRRGR
jgi:hypothetical protein